MKQLLPAMSVLFLSACSSISEKPAAPPVEVKPPRAIDRLALTSVCQPDVARALDTLEQVRGLPVSRYSEAGRAFHDISTAMAIDTAVALKKHAQVAKTKNFVDAYARHQKVVEGLSQKKSEEDDVEEEEEKALQEIRSALAIDLATAFHLGAKISRTGNFAEAYAQKQAQLESLAKRDWKKDEVPPEEMQALQDVAWAHYADVALELRERYKGSAAGAFVEAYKKEEKTLEKFANQTNRQDWEYDDDALCRVLEVLQGGKTQ